MSDHCPTCGAEVRVVGRTTLHYEVLAEAEAVRLRAALEEIKATSDRLSWILSRDD